MGYGEGRDHRHSLKTGTSIRTALQPCPLSLWGAVMGHAGDCEDHLHDGKESCRSPVPEDSQSVVEAQGKVLQEGQDVTVLRRS